MNSSIRQINCAKSIMKRNFQADIGTNDPDDGNSPISNSEDDLSIQLKKSISSVMASSGEQKIMDCVHCKKSSNYMRQVVFAHPILTSLMHL
jgi:hypothetical protein